MAAMRRLRRETRAALLPATRAAYHPARCHAIAEGDSRLMLPHGSSYDEIQRRFRWHVPERYNIGADIADRQAERHGDRLALIFLDEHHVERRLGFRDVSALANRFDNVPPA